MRVYKGEPCVQGALEELDKYRNNPNVTVGGRTVSFKESEGLGHDVTEYHTLLSRILRVSTGSRGAAAVHVFRIDMFIDVYQCFA